MTTSTTKMIAVLATAATLLITNVALAKNGKSGGNFSGGNRGLSLSFGGNNSGNSSHKKSGFSVNFGSGSSQNKKSSNFFKDDHKFNNFDKDNHKFDKFFKDHKKYDFHFHKPYYAYHHCYPNYGCVRVCDVYSGQGYEPYHSTYVCQPGDTFYTVSLKEYGTSSNARYIAQFNRLSLNSNLIAGQTLVLPSISANKTLSVSRAPAANPGFPGPYNNNLAGTYGNYPYNTPYSNPSVPTPSYVAPSSFTTPANVEKPVAEPPRTQVAIGSTLLVDGQTFGEKSGTARLRVSGLSLPIDVIEWTSGAVKIRLPKVDLTSNTPADIEVLRADGSLASKTGVELTTPTHVAGK